MCLTLGKSTPGIRIPHPPPASAHKLLSDFDIHHPKRSVIELFFTIVALNLWYGGLFLGDEFSPVYRVFIFQFVMLWKNNAGMEVGGWIHPPSSLRVQKLKISLTPSSCLAQYQSPFVFKEEGVRKECRRVF